jgi:GPH family glycoside/pentoside/hexuronide:cation symporter
MTTARLGALSDSLSDPADDPTAESDPSGARAPSPPAVADRLPIATLLNYCSPTFGVGIMFFLVGLYLTPFATDVLLISPGAIGAIFLISRLWDAISDPIAGFLSDRTQSRWGRRRPWIAASIIPVCGVYVLTWSPPAGLQAEALVVWMGLGIIGFYTAMTIFIVPHTALGAELTDSYHDRTRIFGFRHVIWTLGSVAAVGLMQLIIDAPSGRVVARDLSLAVGLLTAFLLILSVAFLRERPDFQGRGSDNPIHSFRDVLKNRHARLLLIVYLIENLGGATIVVLTFYVAKYVIIRPDLTGYFILSYMAGSIGFVWMWLPLSRRFGKKQLWLFSMVMTAIAFGGMFFLHEGSIYLISGLALVGGIAAGCGAMIGPSIQADVIDYDEYTTGQRKEGAYFAAWNFVYKSATGITIMASLWVLELVGFEPNVPQTDAVKLAIVSLYSIAPLVCYLVGAALLSSFSLDEIEHARIRTILDQRASDSE